jgi:hypothetical protein
VFENRVLKRIFVLKREEVAGVWKRLHNEELHNLYGTPNIIRVIKTRKMRWASHVACLREMINAYKIFDGKPDGRNHSEEIGVGRKIILG